MIADHLLCPYREETLGLRKQIFEILRLAIEETAETTVSGQSMIDLSVF
jgi:hypothetical protein